MTGPANRIAPLDLAEAAPDAAAILARVKSDFGMLPNVYRVFAHSPVALKGYDGLATALQGGSLSPRLKEQIALLVAMRNGCDYCLAAHRVTGRMARLSPAEIEAAERGDALDPFEAAVLRFAGLALAEAGGLSDDQLDEARKAGLDEARMVEICAHIVANIFTNTVNRLARTPIDFGKSR